MRKSSSKKNSKKNLVEGLKVAFFNFVLNLVIPFIVRLTNEMSTKVMEVRVF